MRKKIKKICLIAIFPILGFSNIANSQFEHKLSLHISTGTEIPISKYKYDGYKNPLIYNAAFGGETKKYILEYGQISGSLWTQSHYGFVQYLSLNIGLVFGL